MQIIKTTCLAVLLGLGSANALAAQGDILVRVRALHVAPDVATSKTLSTLNTGVKQSTVPELDLTYMFTDRIGAELILGVTPHRVTSNAGSLGKVSLLPPTATLQYHFNPEGQFRPYVGAGINYTRFYNNRLSAGGQRVSIDRNSFGPALQAGMDIGIDKNWFVNVDMKKLWIRTDASLGGTHLGTLKIDPWLVGVGFGRRF